MHTDRRKTKLTPDNLVAAGRADNGARRRLHRLRSVRLQQGLSLRSVARRLDKTVSQVRAEEDEATDLPLSTVHRWQKALDVPITELLSEWDGHLSAPVLLRANMLRLMKTARTILDLEGSAQVKRLTQRLVDQLIEIMPELKNVGPWPSTGRRRTLDDLGRIAEHPFPDHLLMDATEV